MQVVNCLFINSSYNFSFSHALNCLNPFNPLVAYSLFFLSSDVSMLLTLYRYASIVSSTIVFLHIALFETRPPPFRKIMFILLLGLAYLFWMKLRSIIFRLLHLVVIKVPCNFCISKSEQTVHRKINLVTSLFTTVRQRIIIVFNFCWKQTLRNR